MAFFDFLKNSESLHLATIVSSAPFGIMILNHKGEIQQMNSKAKEYFGLSGEDKPNFFSFILPER